MPEKGDVVRSVLNRLFELLLIASDYIKPFRRHSFKFGYFAKEFNLRTCISFNKITRGGTHDINLKQQVFSLTPEFVVELMPCSTYIDCAESPGGQNGLQMVMFSILYHIVGRFPTYTRYASAI